MTPQTPDQLGICSWSTHASSPKELIERLEQLGLSKVQLALVPHRGSGGPWESVQQDLENAGCQIVSGMVGAAGEDYSTLESIRRTGGYIRDETWDENWQNILRTSELAASLNLPLVSTHAGFIPSDATEPNFDKLVDRIGRIARRFAEFDITLALETGQETADTLREFLAALHGHGERNVGANFDPANMILYNMGGPVESLEKIVGAVRQVHIKDAVASGEPGQWGTEVPIGEGDVEWKGFLATLADADFTGNLVIEREAGEDRVGDVRKAIDRMKHVMQQLQE